MADRGGLFEDELFFELLSGRRREGGQVDLTEVGHHRVGVVVTTVYRVDNPSTRTKLQ